MRVLYGFAPLVSLVLAASSIHAQDREAAVVARVDSARVTVGDRLTLSLTLEHDSGTTAVFPETQDVFEPFEIARRRPLTFVDSGTVSRSGVEYVLQVFEVGDLRIPSVDVLISGDDGADARVIPSPPVPITVVSVGPDSSDIVDIKPPLAIARNWLLVVPWMVLAGVLLALAYWVYHRYRARHVDESPVPAALPRPPHLVALERLDRLESSPLLAQGKIKQYVSELSEIVRVYIDGRFGIDAMEMASHDVLLELHSQRLPGSLLDGFRGFFATSDLVKFAKLRPEPSTCRRMVGDARRLVHATTPRDEEPTEPDVETRQHVDVLAGRV